MAQPPEYDRQYSFTDYQTANPVDPLPGPELDAELNAVKQTLDIINANLALIQRDDGALANNSVGASQLASGLTLGLNTVEDWVTGTVYGVNDGVWNDRKLYYCLVSHTSTVFATNLAAGKWALILDLDTSLTASEDAQAAAEAAQASAESAAITAQAVAGSVPTITSGDAGKTLQVNSGGTGYNLSFDPGDHVEALIDNTLNLTYYLGCVPYDFTCYETYTKCDSGTCTAQFKINGSAIGGSTQSVSSSGVTTTRSSSNTGSKGGELSVTITASSSCVNARVAMRVRPRNTTWA